MRNQTTYALRVGPLGPPHVHVLSFRGREAISDLYRFDITISAAVPPPLFEPVALGRGALFAIRIATVSRAIRGMIASIRCDGHRFDGIRELYQYTLELVPRMWLLKKRFGSRIHRRQRVDQVIEEVARRGDLRLKMKLEGEFPERDYTTQYEETDYSFVRRLAAENGILFYFKQPPAAIDASLQEALEIATALPEPVADLAALAASFAEAELGLSEMVVFTNQAHYPPLGDGGLSDAASYADLPLEAETEIGGVELSFGAESPAIRFHEGGTMGTPDEEVVTAFSGVRSIRSTRAHYREYDPARPLSPIDRTAEPDESRGALQVGLSLERGATPEIEAPDPGAKIEPADLEVYTHAGTHLFPHWAYGREEAERTLRTSRRRARTSRGVSTSARLEAGHRWSLAGSLGGEHVVVAVRHEGAQWFGDSSNAPYKNTFECVPASVVYVPQRPKPRVVQACHTAIVSGPKNEEIHTNARGEIKVRFHWDRAPESEDSSVWIRVMQPWAGVGWGAQFIPRVGMEVVIVFEGGDPDRPLCIGCVYNGILPVPFQLPQSKTRSGIRTRSTPQGNGHNELSFEDSAGEEQVYLRAERDFDTLVVRNRNATIQADDSTEVAGDRKIGVARSQETRIVENRSAEVKGRDSIEVHGNRDVHVRSAAHDTVDGDRSAKIGGIDRREVVGESRLLAHADVVNDVRGSMTTIVGRADAKRSATLVVEGPTQVTGVDAIDVASDQEIVLRCGESSIRIASGEIEIVSAKVVIRAEDARLLLEEGEAKLKVSSTFQVVSDDKIVLKSSGASLGLQSQAKLDGSQVLLNSPEQASDDIEVVEPEVTTIELKDQDGNPIPYQRFRLVLEDGSEYTGFLDGDGKAEVDVASGGDIIFPELSGVEQA